MPDRDDSDGIAAVGNDPGPMFSANSADNQKTRFIAGSDRHLQQIRVIPESLGFFARIKFKFLELNPRGLESLRILYFRQFW